MSRTDRTPIQTRPRTLERAKLRDLRRAAARGIFVASGRKMTLQRRQPFVSIKAFNLLQ